MLGYYPGCTVRAHQNENFEKEALAILKVLGISVEELSEWECCGAIYPLTNDEYVPLLSSVRALKRTEEEKKEGLLTLCSACYHVLKRVNHRMNNDKEAKRRVENYLDDKYEGTTKVLHLIEVLRDQVGYKKIKEHVASSLEGEKIATYYGCLFLRPEKEMELLDAENPGVMEEIVKALGAEPVIYPYRTDCCGAYHASDKEEVSNGASLKIVMSAKKAGATQLVTACPLCKHNLEHCQKDLQDEQKLPVHFITAPIYEALGAEKKADEQPLAN
ncbi:CoB--CoM heterodisulfide reductase iron-sulfur subunit B family protein [Proteinivorax hydrogeniformans]|uniref:CoB--CoM heterodisulfide reductase iron-sulfur subunit B family protein n=1 Tax=Proteinivorax hydrogeniformans TaxID=1826727 RepID=A0AAU8HVQ4_9FIRM